MNSHPILSSPEVAKADAEPPSKQEGPARPLGAPTALPDQDRPIMSLEQRIGNAENGLFAGVDADVDEFFLELARTGLRVRVLSSGSGPALVLLHGVSLSAAGTGYVLQATGAGLTAATTNSVTVTPAGVATRLAVGTQPPAAHSSAEAAGRGLAFVSPDLAAPAP